jgi:(2Fe-2S) ferredoxin
VLRSKADCLRICAEGPVLLVWPQGIVYGGVSPQRIKRILREHVIGGQPIEAWIVKRMPFSRSGQEPGDQATSGA